MGSRLTTGFETEGVKRRLPTRRGTEGDKSRLPTVICPFCDSRVRASDRVVRCRNCGEAFEPEDCEDENDEAYSAY